MHFITTVKHYPKQHPIQSGLIVIFVIFLFSTILLINDESPAPLTTEKPVVTLTSAAQYADLQSLSLIGTARAVTEAQISAEQTGRVTTVAVSLGQTVEAGQIIATLENASERASVLQAEGVYDAAVAAAAQSGSSLEQAQIGLLAAQNDVVSLFQSAYATTNDVILNSIDDFFSNPYSSLPGLRIDGHGHTAELNAERVAYQTLLSAWQEKANTISTRSDLVAELAFSKANVQRTIDFLDVFITLFKEQDGRDRYTDDEIKSFISEFSSLKNSLINVQSAIDGARSALALTEESLEQAKISTSGGTASVADAQVKQALGALRAAEANLSKTFMRTPIKGTVNSLAIKTGDFITAFSPVAVVANNSALEIITYVSEPERSRIAIGDAVTIEQKYPGTITEIAPAVDSDTRKIEVRIATEAADIVNGDTVRVTKESTEETAVSEKIEIPLSAVKFEASDGYVFVVQEETLVAQPVVLGVVRGSSVEVLEGLSATELFVKDARGLQADTAVEVAM